MNKKEEQTNDIAIVRLNFRNYQDLQMSNISIPQNLGIEIKDVFVFEFGCTVMVVINSSTGQFKVIDKYDWEIPVVDFVFSYKGTEEKASFDRWVHVENIDPYETNSITNSLREDYLDKLKSYVPFDGSIPQEIKGKG